MTTFDPAAPLAGAPDPWHETDAPSRRSAPPYHMTDMIAAEPFVAERVLARFADPVQGPVGSVGAQVDVRVVQPRQHRAAGHVQHLAAIRRRAR